MLDREDQRLARLARLDILDTDREPLFDAFTEAAVAVTEQPIALISLIDRDRQWWKATVGLPQGAGTSRAISFCGHAIAGDGLFEVEDALRDARFADNPLVLGQPGIVHYAGMPLVLPEGEHVGTLCVIGHQPGRLDDRARQAMGRLAEAVVRVLLLRQRDREIEATLRAQQGLRDSEARLRTITQAMPQMVWSTRGDGVPDFYNERWYDYTGEPPGSTRGAAWSELLHADDRPRARQAWAHSLAGGGTLEFEARLRHRSGEYRWVLTRALAVYDDRGQVVRWLGTCTDIEEQKRTQAELELADRRKSDFLALLGHELRNPLAPIDTAAYLLSQAADDPVRVRQKAEIIARQARNLGSLVNDLLDVSKLTRGMVDLHREPVVLQEVVGAAQEQTAPLMATRQHQVTVHADPRPLVVSGEPARLVQVLTNLLNNAAKYTQPGGHIRIELHAQDGQACLSVSDNGSGIPAELLPHVFELFIQEKRTPERGQGGLGLGLSLARNLVELHGGSVTAESPGRGQGSTFRVLLPLMPGA